MESTPEAGHHRVSTLIDYVNVVRRRKMTLITMMLLVPAAAVAYSVHQQSMYRATAGVWINRSNLSSQITNTAPDPTNAQDPERLLQTQADIARGYGVAQGVVGDPSQHVKALVPHTGITPAAFLKISSASPDPVADMVNFSVTSHDPTTAIRLANAYGQQFVAERVKLDTAPLDSRLSNLQQQAINQGGCKNSKSALCTVINTQIARVDTLKSLQEGNATLTNPATTATQVQPATTKNLILAIVAGFILGLAAVFLREALDTRVRSEDEIADRLGIPVLARLSTPARHLRRNDELVTIEEAGSRHVEPYRTLRTNFDFANLGVRARSLLIVSARESEGKSTTVANLAVTLARSGRSVALVDLDLRRPYLHRFFDLAPQPGLTDVAVGNCSLEDALHNVPIGGSSGGNGNRVMAGEVAVLTSGPLPPDPAEFLSHEAVGEILAELRERYDVVLVDSPPVLPVSDAMILSAKVDAMIVITHAGALERDTLEELGRVLSKSMTPRLGFVLAAAESASGYGYGYGSSYYGYGTYAASGENGHAAPSESKLKS